MRSKAFESIHLSLSVCKKSCLVQDARKRKQIFGKFTNHIDVGNFDVFEIQRIPERVAERMEVLPDSSGSHFSRTYHETPENQVVQEALKHLHCTEIKAYTVGGCKGFRGSRLKECLKQRVPNSFALHCRGKDMKEIFEENYDRCIRDMLH